MVGIESMKDSLTTIFLSLIVTWDDFMRCKQCVSKSADS